MTLSLDGARERVMAANSASIDCVLAIWTYRYANGYTVTLRGPLTAHVVVIPSHPANGASAQGAAQHPSYAIKISHFSFESDRYEKFIAVDVIGGTRLDSPKTPRLRNTMLNGANGKEEERWEDRVMYERASIPQEPVNAFGIPQATMRCLEVSSPAPRRVMGLT